MTATRPIYKKLLIAAIAIFVVGVSYMFCDIYIRLCAAEHDIVCINMQGCSKDGGSKHSHH